MRACLIVLLSQPSLEAEELPSRAMCRSRTFKIAPRTPRRIISMPRPKACFAASSRGDSMKNWAFSEPAKSSPSRPPNSSPPDRSRFSSCSNCTSTISHFKYSAAAIRSRTPQRGLPGRGGRRDVHRPGRPNRLSQTAPHGRNLKPGRYKVEIHAGEQINDMSLMGTMRFIITAASESDVPAKSQ